MENSINIPANKQIIEFRLPNFWQINVLQVALTHAYEQIQDHGNYRDDNNLGATLRMKYNDCKEIIDDLTKQVEIKKTSVKFGVTPTIAIKVESVYLMLEALEEEMSMHRELLVDAIQYNDKEEQEFSYKVLSGASELYKRLVACAMCESHRYSN